MTEYILEEVEKLTQVEINLEVMIEKAGADSEKLKEQLKNVRKHIESLKNQYPEYYV